MNTKVADICEDLLGRGFTIRLRVEGRSMVPTILAGAWITVVPVEHKNLKSWDILLYRNENRIVAHRLIDGLRVGYPLLLRGDACLYTESVQASQILGRVVAAQSHGKVAHLKSSVAMFRYALLLLKRKLFYYLRGPLKLGKQLPGFFLNGRFDTAFEQAGGKR